MKHIEIVRAVLHISMSSFCEEAIDLLIAEKLLPESKKGRFKRFLERNALSFNYEHQNLPVQLIAAGRAGWHSRKIVRLVVGAGCMSLRTKLTIAKLIL